jgi:hypothetical protein
MLCIEPLHSGLPYSAYPANAKIPLMGFYALRKASRPLASGVASKVRAGAVSATE